MSNDNGPIADGDDAFAGADGEQPPGVPDGWPGAEESTRPTGQPTSPATGQASANAARAAYEDAAKQAQTQPEPSKPQPGADEEHPDTALAAERLDELKREQARFVNYQRRVERDRADDRTRVAAALLESMIPVLDEIYLARQHGDLESGPMAKIAEKLEAVLSKQGVERYGQPGETFDPVVHEAVMHTHAELAPGTTETTVIQVMQPGYKIGDRVVRAALVAVADPQ